MKIVLDTHILIHASTGKLTRARIELLNDGRNILFFSSISLWEITKLYEHRRIRPEREIQAYLSQFTQHPKYTSVGLTPEVLACVLQVAPKLHKDPADQLIVATALTLSAKLMTDDQKIQDAGIVETV